MDKLKITLIITLNISLGFLMFNMFIDYDIETLLYIFTFGLCCFMSGIISLTIYKEE